MTAIEQLSLQFNIKYFCTLATIEQPENCKAFIPMHRSIYNRSKETGHRIVEGWFLLACKESIKNAN